MIRKALFVLLLATGIALAAEAPTEDASSASKPGHDAAATEAKTDQSADAAATEAKTDTSASKADQDADAAATEAKTDQSADAAEAKHDAGADKAKHDASATETKTKTKDGAKLISGMSVLGNQEAPKSLVIVPWKSSQIGEALGITTMLDDSRQPVDKDVFMRELSYYEVRSEKTP